MNLFKKLFFITAVLVSSENNIFAQQKSRSVLTPLDDKKWQSTQGLIYGSFGRDGTILDHILAHTQRNCMKDEHTIFSVPPQHIVELIDAAWIKRKKPAKKTYGDCPCTYIIDMEAIVGTQGETGICIVLKKPFSSDSPPELLTAYPVKIGQ